MTRVKVSLAWKGKKPQNNRYISPGVCKKKKKKTGETVTLKKQKYGVSVSQTSTHGPERRNKEGMCTIQCLTLETYGSFGILPDQLPLPCSLFKTPETPAVRRTVVLDIETCNTPPANRWDMIFPSSQPHPLEFDWTGMELMGTIHGLGLSSCI